MRRLCLCLSFLLAALIVAPNANAQGGLNLNQTYRDVIRLHFPAGKTQIPLPEGEWELLGLQEDQASEPVRIWRVYLARVEDNILLGQVMFDINTDLWDGGWLPSSFCDKDNLYFIEVKSNKDNDVDCWAVDWYRQNPNKPRSEGWQQMYNTLLARNVAVLRKMTGAAYQRRNTDNYLALYYHFNTYPSGKPSVTRERLKSWARDWKAKVDAGFLGELEATKR